MVECESPFCTADGTGNSEFYELPNGDVCCTECATAQLGHKPPEGMRIRIGAV